MTKRLIILIIAFLCIFSQIYATKSPTQMQETFELQEKLLEYPKYVLSALKKAYPEKSIWAFSGYLFDKDILAGRLGPAEITNELIGYLDVLVDGPFIMEKKDLSLRFRGSSNQRLIDVPASVKTGQIVLWQDWQ